MAIARLGLPLPLATFEPGAGAAIPRSARARVVVTAMPLPFDVDAEDWSRFRGAARGWAVVASEPAETASGPGLAMTFERAEGLVRHDVGLVARRSLVTVHVVGTRASWPEVVASVGTVGASMRIHGDHDAAVERRVCNALAAGVTVELPASWRPRAIGGTQGQPHATTHFEAIGGAGWIAIRATPRSAASVSLGERSAALSRWLVDRRIAVREVSRADLPRSTVLAAQPGWRGGFLLDAWGPCLRPLEVRTWHVDLARADIDAMLVVDHDASRPLSWMRGIRALEIAIASLREDGCG